MRICHFALFSLLSGGGHFAVLPAQEPLNPPAPLMAPMPAPTISAGMALAMWSDAQRAQELGLSSIAAGRYRQLLKDAGTAKPEVMMALTTVLLESGQTSEAEKVLAEFPSPRNSAWHLRASLVAIHLKRIDAARREHDTVKFDELSPSDRPWYWFVQGGIFDLGAAREMVKANDSYRKAERAATTELSRARFQLAGERVRLRIGKPNETDLRQMRANHEKFRGTATGFDAAETYAVMLNELGRTSEAVQILQGTLVYVPVQDRERWDDFRLTLGLIGDRGRNGVGRTALLQLVEGGHSLERQRQALYLLAEASRSNPMRVIFEGELNKLIALPNHPIRESLLFYRAQLALTEKRYAVAEDDAKALLEQFPGSPLRVHAFGLLTSAAWEQARFRLAADFATKARAEAAPGPWRAKLGVLAAEAWFRGKDYRSAADAYTAALVDAPEGVQVGDLMFQRILAEIKAGSGEAVRILDELEENPAFDLENRWEAEWNLARAFQTQGDAKINEAFARVNVLLAAAPASAPRVTGSLRARMLWLQARLSYDAKQSARTLELVESLPHQLEGLDPALRDEIASRTALLKAEAQFELAQETAAIATLNQLRNDFKKTEAAIASHLIEAEHYAAQGKIGEAQKILIRLTDDADYQNSPNTPLALYRSALLSEQLGQTKEAYNRVEDLVKKYPQSELVFAARLKQGDLLRKMQQFPQAQQVYEDLVNKPTSQADLILAQLALAACHNAQSSVDSAHADSAQLLFEHLRDRVDAPTDVRVEAGYNLGALLAVRGSPDKALEVWWSLVEEFVQRPKAGVKLEATAPYWMGRTLLEMGELLEQRSRLEEAKILYSLILDKGLANGEAAARSRLARLGVIDFKG